MIERSLVILKPDAVQRNLIGGIINRFEKKGLKLVALKFVQFDEKLLREHYSHVANEPFFPELSKFMELTPVVIFILEGLKAIEIVRNIAGIRSTDLGSIRGDYSISSQRNVIHSSDSLSTAEQEIKRFFSDKEIFDYNKDESKYMIAKSDEK